MKGIIVGSNHFFRGLDGFASKDTDILYFEENPRLYNFYRQVKKNNTDEFFWNVNNVFQYDYNNNPMAVGKFLIPEVLEALNVTFDDVKPLLEEFLPKLEPRHSYQQKIYDFYIANGKMKLTKKQLQDVYDEYKKTREYEKQL